MDAVRYRVSGLIRTNYYAQLKDGDRPTPFTFDVMAEGPERAADKARAIALRSKGKIACIRTIEETRLVPEGKTDPLVDHHAIDWDDQWYNQKLVAVDVETTGLDPVDDRIVEIGWAIYSSDEKAFGDHEFRLVNEGKHIPKKLTDDVHGISNEDIADKPSIDEIEPGLREVFQGAIVVAQNRGFDVAFLQNSFNRHGFDWTLGPSVCTKMLAESMDIPGHTGLGGLCDYFGVDLENAHRAGDDAKACGDVFLKLARHADSPFRKPTTAFELIHYFDHTTWPNDP